jgi:tetratricopeptide (TPR) repeat protein
LYELVIKKKKILMVGTLASLILVVIFTMITINNQYRNKIPEFTGLTLISPAVNDQIAKADLIARKNPTAENLGILGMIYHSSANYSYAEECYKLAVKRKKSEWKWNYYLGYLNLEMGKSEDAIENFKQVTEKNPENFLAWYYLGDAYKNIRNNELSEQAYNVILSSNHKTSDTHTRIDHFSIRTYTMFKLARFYFETGRLELAEETLLEIVKNDNLFGSAYRLLGNIYNVKGDAELGYKYTMRANDLIAFSSPVDPMIDKLSILSRSELFLLKQIDEAERSIHSDWALKLVNHGLQYMPENKHLISKAIKINLWRGLNDMAIGFTEKHMVYFQEDFIEIKNTGMLFYQKGLYPIAANYWRKAMELKPDDSTIPGYLAKCYWAIGDRQNTYEILNKLNKKHEGNAEVLAETADLFYQFGAKEEAEKLLEKIKRLSPANSKAQRLWGEIAEEKGDFRKAISLYESSFHNDPYDLLTIRNLGNIYLNQNMWKDYITHYNEALSYHPNNPEILGRLGESYLNCPDTSLRDIQKGKEYSERAFTNYECPPDILITSGSHLAYAYALLGDKPMAVSTITKTINIGRREKIPAASQNKLENFYRTLQQTGN